ncbi:MAG: phage tail fiber protein [Pyrinomonadaceae bacterium]
MYSTQARNVMLDNIGVTFASLHTAYSNTGANEVTGGAPAYARKSITFNAASGGTKAANNAPVFDVPPGTTIRFMGLWDALTAGNFKGMLANVPSGGITEFEVYADLTADKILRVAHGLVNDNKVVFYNGTPPAPLVEGTVYFVVNKTANDFQVSATQGGAAIDLTAQATDSVVCSQIIEEAFGSQGTETVSTTTLGLNN